MKPQSKIAVFLLIAVIGLFSQSIISSDNGSLLGADHKKNQKEKHDKNQKGKHDKDQKDEKVLMCHTPPGNPANKHEIWVCPDDVQNHLAHGDFLGSCIVAPPPPVDDCVVACNQAYDISVCGGDLPCEQEYNQLLLECLVNNCQSNQNPDYDGGGGGDAGGGDAGGDGGEDAGGEEGGGIPDSV